MKFVLLYILIYIPVELKAYRDIDTLITKNIKSVINLEFGNLIGNGVAEFFDIYNMVMKKGVNLESTEGFSNSLSWKFAYKLKVKEKYRIGIEALYYETKMYDLYDEDAIYFSEHYSRKHIQEVIFKSIPFLISFDYLPFSKSQFRTYYGISIGVTSSEIKWNEEVLTPVDKDPRKDGISINDNEIFGTYRIYSGLELGFDKEEKKSFFGGVIFEIGLTHILNKYKVFASLNNQLTKPKEELKQEIKILPLYISMNMGISFNFYY